VTLDKSEGYHDRIAYHDYAISPERFHWQTQYSAGPDTPAGSALSAAAGRASSNSLSGPARRRVALVGGAAGVG
jgi:hypothetical protein